MDDHVLRASALEAAVENMGGAGALCIVGAPGVGKTVLAAQLVRRLQGPQGVVCWHPCYAGDNATAVLWAIAGSLFHSGAPALWQQLFSVTRPGSAYPPGVLVRGLPEYLRGARLVVCLDDVHWIADDPLAEPLLRGLAGAARAGHIRLVATGRSTPPALAHSALPLEGMDAGEARRLLAQQLLALDERLFGRLYAITAGNPQLLALAAAALGTAADPGGLIERLADTADISSYLKGKMYDGLSEAEQKTMQALAVLAGEPASRDAVEAVLDCDGLWVALEQLRARHLVQAHEHDGARSFALHELLGRFFYGTIGARQARPYHRRAAEFYVGAEANRLRAARHFASAGVIDRAADLAAWEVWELIGAGRARALAALLTELDAQALDLDRAVAVRLALAEVSAALGEAALAERRFTSLLRELLPQLQGAARLLRELQVYRGLGQLFEGRDTRRAAGYLRRGLRALRRLRALGHPAPPLEQARLEHRLGSVLLAQGGKAGRAGIVLEHALAVLARVAQPDQAAAAARWRADILVNLGVAFCERGDLERGSELFGQARALYERIGDDWGLAAALTNLAMVDYVAGRPGPAARTYREAADLARRIGDVQREAQVALNLGVLIYQLGDGDRHGDDAARARVQLERCLELVERYDLTELRVAVNLSLADLLLRQGAPEGAAAALRAAEAAAGELGAHDQRAELMRCRARLHLARGELAPALAAAEAAVRHARDDQDAREEELSLHALAEVRAAAGAKAA